MDVGQVLRRIPKMDALLALPEISQACERFSYPEVKHLIGQELDRIRRQVLAGALDEVPAQEAPRPPQDVEYLGALTDQDIDVAGVEDQLIGTATTICNPEGTGIDQATVPAVAGQLVEQGRTDRSAEELTQLIVDNARQAYC